MKKFRIVVGIAILTAPLCGSVFGQDDFTSVDLSSILNQGGNGNRGNNRGPSIPDSKILFQQIQDTLKKGKTPLEKEQIKPLQSLLDTEIVALTDKLQLMRNNNGYPNNNNNNAANNNAANNKTTAAKGATPTPNPPSEQAIKVDTITSLKNEDFLNTKLALFLSPEQAALIQKAHAEDKNNSTCLGGLLDHYFNQMNNSNRGNNNNNNNNFNNNRGNSNNSNNNNNNSNSKDALRPNGQKYCMTQEVTPLDRIEPIRKILAKGNLPLAADKNMIAEVVMKAQLQDLDAALRSGLTSNNNNNNNNFNRGNNNNNNRNNFQQVIQTTTDNLYKKVEASLNPAQADTIKKWHYTEMLSRTPIDALIAVNAMQDTPLSEEQITKVTAAWPELRKEVEAKAKAAKLQITEKQRDSEAMRRILDMIEPEQVASYQLAKKYGPEAVAGK
jgi:hypothetical protein